MNYYYPSLDRFDVTNVDDSNFMDANDIISECSHQNELRSPCEAELLDEPLPQLIDENPWATCEALETNKDFTHDQWDMIFDSSNDANKENICTDEKPQCTKTQQKLTKSRETKSILSALQNNFQNDASTIPFFNKTNFEVGRPSNLSPVNQLEEMIFPSLPGEILSHSLTNVRKGENARKEVSKHKINADFKTKLEKPNLACELMVTHSENKAERVEDSLTDMGANFRPSNWDVIFGRGKDAYDHIGNRRFKIIVAMHLREYADAKNQMEKAHLVDRIIKQIREASPNAGFVKKDGRGNWRKLDTAAVQQRVARTFRDSMIGLLRCNSRFSPDEKRRNTIEAQNTIFRSCQIRFSRDVRR